MSGIVNPDDFFRQFGGRKPNYHELFLPPDVERRLIADDQKGCNICRDIRMLVFERRGHGYVFYDEIMRHPKLVSHLTKIWSASSPKNRPPR